MTFSADSLRAALAAHLPSAATGLVVALSGGADSASLLAALTHTTVRFRRLPLRAVHVDHGLQAAAADFCSACRELCRRLGVPLRVVRASVDAAPGVSLEAAARAARYAALAQDLGAGECLLTAHHARDQAETVLLQLLRGAGIKGLSAMPACRPWAGGWHVRPLLEFEPQALREFGASAGVAAVEDPMNVDLRYDRVYLRERVWPVIVQRWPGATQALSRAARHAADAQELLARSALATLQRLRDGDALSVPGLRALDATERRQVMRCWISARRVPLPSSARLGEALRQILSADADHVPAIKWGEHALRRYRDRVFLTPAAPPAIGAHRPWQVATGAQLSLDAGLGSLRWAPRSGGLDARRLTSTLEVRGRRGGECLRPQRRGRTRTLSHLCQSLGILPWMRDALPLVYAGADLIAVGDLWLDADWCSAPGAPGLACVWQDAPNLM